MDQSVVPFDFRVLWRIGRSLVSNSVGVGKVIDVYILGFRFSES
jgi:hypothetical protein